MNIPKRFWLFGVVVVILCSLYSHSVVAQEPRIRETNREYRQGDWITYGTTRFVRYISIGNTYVYFATTGGITRLNKFTYKWDFPWTKSNGLPDNDIFLVAEDLNTGFLWAVTNQGISYLEPATQMWNNSFYDELGMYNEYITSIGIGSDRQIYVITSDNRWFVSDNITANFRSTNPPTSEAHITWYGGKENRSSSLPNFFMDGGYLFDSRQQYIDDLQFRRWEITTWIRDDWNNLWIGTWGLGAGRGDMLTLRLEMLNFGLWDETVDAIGRDSDGYWVGGIQEHDEPAAVTEWDGMQRQPNYYEAHLISGFSNAQITSVVAGSRNVWFGTLGGLIRFDKRNNNWRTYTVAYGLANDQISKLARDKDFLWIATASGVSKLHLNTVGSDSMRIESLKLPSHRIIQVYDLAQQDNLLWMATEFGVYVHNKLTGEGGYFNGLDENIVGRPTFAISAWGEEIWFGTDEGVSGFNSVTNEWLESPAVTYKTEAGINRILATRQATWVATNDGVLKYDKEMQRWRRFTVQDGLSDNRVYSLQLEGDYIFFGTPRGLTKFYWNSPFRND